MLLVCHTGIATNPATHTVILYSISREEYRAGAITLLSSTYPPWSWILSPWFWTSLIGVTQVQVSNPCPTEGTIAALSCEITVHLHSSSTRVSDPVVSWGLLWLLLSNCTARCCRAGCYWICISMLGWLHFGAVFLHQLWFLPNQDLKDRSACWTSS